MRTLILTILLFTGCTSPAFAQTFTFAPENDLQIGELSDVHANAVAKANFQRAIALVYNAYASEVAQRGAKLQINDLWSNSTANAQAYRVGRVWHVDAFGGLARHSLMTTAGYVGVLCHELGHHIGGRPRYSSVTTWASVEGQSDYWGFQRCMAKVMPGEMLSAAISMANVLASLDGERMPRVDTPDRTIVTQTMESHPPVQCRFDTMLAAIRNLARPRCWFRG